MKPSFVVPLLIAATLLSGCGRQALTQPAALQAGALAASDVVGLPVSYQPGMTFPGQNGAPSLTKANFPRFTHTPEGKSSDPVNLLVAGSERQVRHIFGARGWVGADPINAVTTARMIKAALTNGDYPTSPMSELRLYNRAQDMAWQKNQIGVRARDHLRVWKTPLRDGNNRPFWAIAATKDVAIKLGPGEKAPTHQISPDIDAERLMVTDEFVKSGHVALRYQLQAHAPNTKGVNGGGDEFFTDGRVEVLELVVLKD